MKAFLLTVYLVTLSILYGCGGGGSDYEDPCDQRVQTPDGETLCIKNVP